MLFRFSFGKVLTMSNTHFTPYPYNEGLGIYRMTYRNDRNFPRPEQVVRVRFQAWAKVHSKRVRPYRITLVGDDLWEISTRKACPRCGR